MALRGFTAAAVVGVAAGTINLSIEDCGDSSTHGHVSGISPSTVPQGTSVLVSGSGQLDTAVSDGSFEVKVKALGVTLQSCSGDLCGASKCALPGGTGSVDFRGVSCPLEAGDVTLGFDVAISSAVPSSLARLEIDISSTGSAGNLLCAKIRTSPGLASGDDESKYEEWKTAFGSNGGEQEFQVFQSNLRLIEQMQANDPSATYSHMTPFANISPEDFKTRNGYRATAGATQAPLLDVSNMASSYDWRDHGAVNPIKDQGQCGSCWAFSTVANIEGVGQVETGKLISLSEQQLVDCDSSDGGCNGGLPSNAFQYMIDQGMGLESESAYPYKARDASCSQVASQEQAFITGWHQISTDETQVAAAVQQYGPLSIGINANTFQFYTGGVSDPLICNPAALDHGVAIVGFGTADGKDYWTIRNSWGSSWGEAGYIRMVRGKGACGLNTDVTTATGISTQMSVQV